MFLANRQEACPRISTSASSRSAAGSQHKPKALDAFPTAVGLWAGAKQGHQSTGQLHRCLRSHLRSHFYTPCAQPSTILGRRVRDQQAKRLWVLPLGSKVGAHLAGDALVPFRAGCSWDTTRPPIPSKRHRGASSSATLY